MEIQKIFSEINTDEKLYSVLMSEDELALFSEIQKEFNSKAQKKRRRYYDYKIGEKTLNNPDLSLSKRAFIKESAENPGEFMTQAYYDKADGNYHVKGKFRPGVSEEKASRLKENLQKLDLKGRHFHKGLVAGRIEQNELLKDSIDEAKEKAREKFEARKKQKAAEAIENAAKDTAKTVAQESTQKAAPVMNQVNKNGSGMLKKGMEWASRNKVGLGIAAGTTALAGGGAYLYKRAKKKNQDKDNN